MEEFKTVAELLSVPNRWRQGYYSIEQLNDPKYIEKESFKYCLEAALVKVYKKDYPILRLKLLKALKNIGFRGSLSKFNDSHSHREILELVQEAGV